jgi:hypothetical protein
MNWGHGQGWSVPMPTWLIPGRKSPEQKIRVTDVQSGMARYSSGGKNLDKL